MSTSKWMTFLHLQFAFCNISQIADMKDLFDVAMFHKNDITQMW